MLDKSDPVVKITCGGTTVASSVVKDSTEPVWNQLMVFGCRGSNTQILLVLEDDNLLLNEFMGRLVLRAGDFGWVSNAILRANSLPHTCGAE